MIRDRRHLSEDGILLPILAINKHTGKIESAPEIISRGFSDMDNDSAFMQMARQIVTTTVEESNREEKTDWGVMKEKIRGDLKRYVNKQTQKRPLIIPVILESDPMQSATAAIAVTNLVKRYAKAKTNAVDGVTFDVFAAKFSDSRPQWRR